MKKKIFNYDFLIVGGGLIGSLTAVTLHKKNFKVLVIDKNKNLVTDQRTLAVNANSRKFLNDLNLWTNLKNTSEDIDKIIISDYINRDKIIFENKDESMGSVIFNADLQKILRSYLKNNKLLINNINFEKLNTSPSNTVIIKNEKYKFKKIILALGKNFNNHDYVKKNLFQVRHKAYVGFFKHQKKHFQIAYEKFTKHGPLAVLPCPDKTKKHSTFIFSTTDQVSEKILSSNLKKFFTHTHGKIVMNNEIFEFPILAHLTRPAKKNFILLGDNFRAIHPVAGQGWNLGIKDIQTLSKILDEYSITEKRFDEIFFSRRQIENFSYLLFTNTLNNIYESDTILSKKIIKAGFTVLNNFSFLKKIFINQAMGVKNLI